MRTTLAAVATLALVAGPLAGQQPRTVEVGGFGRYTVFDRTLGYDEAIGGGARLAVFLSRTVSLEADASYTPTNFVGGGVLYVPIHARLLFHVPLGPVGFFSVGPAYAHNRYGIAGESVFEDGIGGLAGFRFPLGRRATFRVDGTVDFIPSPLNAGLAGIENWNYGLQAGLSLQLGGRAAPPDADRDGIADRLDRCPATPRGERVDATGCPLPRDADGDGILDPDDRCPGTPSGTKVDRRGCPLTGEAAADADGDGVTDASDRCPGTPRGERVDAFGCPLAQDSDGDGVRDDRDRCPNTPPGTRVDGSGCRVLFEEGALTLRLEGVTFDPARATLTSEARSTLRTVAQALVANPDIRVEVAGHTDAVGDAGENLRLSQGRAEAVRTFLIQLGVEASRLTARGYGESSPIASNRTASGRAQNRRVELRRVN